MSGVEAGKHPVQALLSVPNSNWIVAASHNSLSVFDLEGKVKVAASTAPHKALVRVLASHETRDGSKYLVSSGEDKLLAVHSLPDLEVLSTRELNKRANAIEVTLEGEIVVGDKFGDVYRYRLIVTNDAAAVDASAGKSETTKQSPIMGHVSMLTAVALIPPSASTSQTTLIATGDRDEHVRLSRYPDAFVIEDYLWGSTKFIAALLHLPETETTPPLLLSAGGDPAIQVYDLKRRQLVNQVLIDDLVLPYVTVAPTPPKPIFTPRHGKGNNNNQKNGKGKGKDRVVDDDTVEASVESEAQAEVEERVEEGVTDDLQTTGESEDVVHVRTIGPHAWKDGFTTGLAVIKLVRFGEGVVVLAAGATALLYVPLSLLVPNDNDASDESSSPIPTILELDLPILDISLSSALSQSSIPNLYASLDSQDSSSSSSSSSATKTDIVKISFNVEKGTLVKESDETLATLVLESAVPLSTSIARPPVSSLYPALSLLVMTPEAAEEDLGSGPGPTQQPPLEDGGGEPQDQDVNGKKKRPRVSLEQRAPRKRGKRHDARDKLQERLESLQKAKQEGVEMVTGQGGGDVPREEAAK